MRRVSIPDPLPVSEDDKHVYGPANRYEIFVDAELDGEGRVKCAEPLSGRSIYWPYALDAIERNKKNIWHGKPGRVIVSFEDPTFVGGEHFRRTSDREQPCDEANELSDLLLQGAIYLDKREDEAALHCYSLALDIAPNSLAANYGAAWANRQMKRWGERVRLLNRVVSLNPNFYEAQLDLAFTLGLALHSDKTTEALVKLVDMDPPLRIKARVYGHLVWAYDRSNRREQALTSKRDLFRVKQELHRRYAPLVSTFDLWMEGKDLAVRLEEHGLLEEALAAFETAFELSMDDSVHEAYRFETDLGRARALGRIGRTEKASTICSKWKLRIRTVSRDPETPHWGGRRIAEAKLKATCGDFNRAVQTLLKEAARDPSSDVPYRVLASIYRARGESDVARDYASLAERIRTALDTATLQRILEEAEQLMRSGKIQKYP